MERPKHDKAKKKKLLGSHQRAWVWGRHVVMEILEAGRWPVVQLLLDEALPKADLEKARDLAARRQVVPQLEPARRLVELCHTSEHQGFLARMAEFPYAEPSEILERIGQGARELFVILDSIHDPYNFGAIVRSAEAFGLDAVFIGSKRQARVSSMVARSSAGAVNHLPIAQVEDLAALAEELRAKGVALIGATEKADLPLSGHDFARPTAIVLGNESRGIGADLLRVCDAQVGIPQHGAIGSLNVGAAAAVIFYEARRGLAVKTQT
jgi:23S rRNA (guanosine2251-2'-O)-methyltransferase